MTATDRKKLGTIEFADALRAAADLISTDAFDGVKVLDERRHADQGESLNIMVSSEQAVRAFAKRHGVAVEENRREDGSVHHVTATVGFGRGTKHDATYGPPAAYLYAFTLDVTYTFPDAAPVSSGDAARRVL